MKKHIPNFITLCNLFCGCVAVYNALWFNYYEALWFLLIAALFDFLDGLVARLIKAYSEVGRELDSLADVISFGFAPASIAYSMLWSAGYGYVSFVALLIVAFSALRLAKFNVSQSNETFFIGLPTPANAIFWGGLSVSYGSFLAANPYIIVVLAVVSSLTLVSPLPMFSLKVGSLNIRQNIWQVAMVSISVVLVAIFWLDAIMWIIVAYVALSLLKFFLEFGKVGSKNG